MVGSPFSIVDPATISRWFSSNEPELTLDRSRILRVVLVVQALLLVIVGIEGIGYSLSIIRSLVAIGYLTFVPGLLLAVLLDLENHRFAVLCVYIIGLSLALIMVVGAVASLVYPMVGVQRPLRVDSYLLTMLGVVVVLGALVRLRRNSVSLRVPLSGIFTSVPLAFLLLPFVSVFGTVLFKVRGINILLLGLLVTIAAIPVLVAERRFKTITPWMPLAIWTISLALLYHGGLWPLVGGHQEATITLNQGVWNPTNSTLASNGVLFPTYALFTDVPLGYQWNVVNPFLVSFIPLILFLTFSGYLTRTRAFVATCFFMFSFPFYVLYPGAGRVATPILFLGLIALVLTDQEATTTSQSILSLIFGIGLAVSHYGTAFVVMFAFLTGGCVYAALGSIDKYIRSHDTSLLRQLESDGGVSDQGGFHTNVLSLSYLSLYSTFVLSWYLYTGDGVKFAILPRKVVDAVQGVLYGQLSGSAAGAVARDFGNIAITASKWLYILIGALMAVGLLLAVLDRLYRGKTQINDEFLALAAGFMAMLGASFLPAGTGFNIARVMMIVFTFTAPFVLFGVDRLSDAVSRVTVQFRGMDAPNYDFTTAFALVLSVFLLLNSGVVSETVTHDIPPSTKVSTERLLASDDPAKRLEVTRCSKCNIQTHSWIMDAGNNTTQTYTDRTTQTQVDFYRGELTDRVGFVPSNAFYGMVWNTRNGTNESGYIVLMPHNYDTSGVTVHSRYDWRPYDGLTQVFEESDILYDGGNSSIYMTRGKSTTSKLSDGTSQLIENSS